MTLSDATRNNLAILPSELHNSTVAAPSSRGSISPREFLIRIINLGL